MTSRRRRSHKRSRSSKGAWGRTKLQLKKKWDRRHRLGKPIQSMKDCSNFNEWLDKLRYNEKMNRRKPQWAAY